MPLPEQTGEGLGQASDVLRHVDQRDGKIAGCAQHTDAQRAHEDHLAFDGLPVPPARLRLLVDGRSGDAAHFLRVGRRMFESIRDAVAASGTDPRKLGAVLLTGDPEIIEAPELPCRVQDLRG